MFENANALSIGISAFLIAALVIPLYRFEQVMLTAKRILMTTVAIAIWVLSLLVTYFDLWMIWETLFPQRTYSSYSSSTYEITLGTIVGFLIMMAIFIAIPLIGWFLYRTSLQFLDWIWMKYGTNDYDIPDWL